MANGAIVRFTALCAKVPAQSGEMVMAKIPVGETIAHAYGFAFREFPKLLGIVWAPLAVSIAVGLMMTPGFFGNHIDPNDQDAIERYSTQMLPLSLLILLPIRAMIATGVTEQALGMRTGVTFVYFSIGSAIWRFLASWLLVIVAMIVLLIGTAIAAGILFAIGGIALGSMLHGPSTQIVSGLAVIAFVLFFYGAAIYLTVRLTFFIPPVVVAEKKIDLARAWQLSHGNFWRIFVVGLALFIPLIAIVAAVMVAIYGTTLFHIVDIFSAAIHGAQQPAIQEQTQAWSEAVRVKGLAMWPYDAVFQLLFGTFTYGLTYSASAFAYREIQPSSVPSLRN
jgi:hypothetical protein